MKKTAYIITIGDEILIGQVVDTNSAWISKQLYQHNIQVSKILSVSDTERGIRTALEDAKENADLVLLTGGLGPTKDDITKHVLADFFETSLVFDEKTYARIVDIFNKRDRKVTDLHHQQCFLPESATLLTNEKGSAPGMWFEKEEVIYVSMPGVPREMKYLMEAEVLPKIKEIGQEVILVNRTILTSGMGESNIAKRLTKFEEELPENASLAYLPSPGMVRLRISLEGNNPAELIQVLDQLTEQVQELIPELIAGYDLDSLEECLAEKLLTHAYRIGTAESCTGGFIAHKLTRKSGSSAYFEGSIIAYSNHIKETILKVNKEILDTHGAVSVETVEAMVKGTINLLGVDMAVAVSGIAGPTGARPDKPVGTVCIAVGNQDAIVSQRFQFSGDRMKNIHLTTNYALNMCIQFLKNNE